MVGGITPQTPGKGVPGDNTVQAKYRSAGKNTLYFLSPDTPNIYLLDFSARKFVKKKL